MAREAVVVGGGPGALRAASAIAAQGREVTLLQAGPWAQGHDHADIPIGRGVSPDPGDLSRQVCGAFEQVAGLERAVLLDGRIRPLPLSRGDLARYVKPTRLPSTAFSWGRTRGASELQKLIGGGFEQRTYRDWVVQRFGEPVFDRFHAAYCQARFGEPTAVSCNVARLYHGQSVDVPLFAPSGGPAPVDKGVTVRTNVAIRSVQGGQVETDEGIFTGDVFADTTPRHLVRWLGERASLELRNDVDFLGTRHCVQVLVRGQGDLPFETHVLGGAPFFRILRPGLLPGCGALADTLVVHYSVGDGDPLLTASDADCGARTVEGLGALGVEASADGARAQVLRDHHPLWVGNHLVRMRRYLLALEDLEITPVGRGGLHAPLDLAAEFRWMESVLVEERPSLRALYRDIVEPPVLDSVERPHLTRFVER